MAETHSVLLTGATGFIGSHLVKVLSAAGEPVHVLTRKDSNLSILQPFLKKIRVHAHDGSMENLISILKTVQPELVFHLATHFLSTHTSKDITDLVNSNLLFGLQLLEAMDAAGSRLIINAATTWQHYQDQDYDPVNLYAATKQAFEDLLKYYILAKDFKAVTLELTDTYGPGDRRQKLFALLQKAAQSGEKLSMSPGEQLLDLLYIDDVTRAFMLGKRMLENNEVTGYDKYQISAARLTSLKEVASLYESLSGTKLDIEWGGRSYRQREVLNPWNQGKILPGWKPEINLEEGIKRMLAQKQIAD